MSAKPLQDAWIRLRDGINDRHAYAGKPALTQVQEDILRSMFFIGASTLYQLTVGTGMESPRLAEIEEFDAMIESHAEAV